ncbi:MAG: DUF4276 family protein [Gammaproteobacteria bacterium AqS3]|nr:DUF4276 family protein [Gammaproteobacteria bacterium AqS3]
MGHRNIVGALIERVAEEMNIQLTPTYPDYWRNARRGYGYVVYELQSYFRDLKERGGLPDFIVVATDANSEGLNKRTQNIPIEESPVLHVVLAIPDPHVERWLLLDSKAFKKVLGKGCKATDYKNEPGRYKHELIEACREATGIAPEFRGIEYARKIVQEMDLNRAAKNDRSLKRFLKELRDTFQQISQLRQSP